MLQKHHYTINVFASLTSSYIVGIQITLRPPASTDLDCGICLAIPATADPLQAAVGGTLTHVAEAEASRLGLLYHLHIWLFFWAKHTHPQ